MNQQQQNQQLPDLNIEEGQPGHVLTALIKPMLLAAGGRIRVNVSRRPTLKNAWDAAVADPQVRNYILQHYNADGTEMIAPQDEDQDPLAKPEEENEPNRRSASPDAMPPPHQNPRREDENPHTVSPPPREQSLPREPENPLPTPIPTPATKSDFQTLISFKTDEERDEFLTGLKESRIYSIAKVVSKKHQTQSNNTFPMSKKGAVSILMWEPCNIDDWACDPDDIPVN